MTFEEYRDSIIEDFIEDCICCNQMEKGQELTVSQYETIYEAFEEHRSCFEEEYEAARDDGEELIVSCIYGNKINASIECLNCETVIVDTDVLFGE